jgi:hypothetical protein
MTAANDNITGATGFNANQIFEAADTAPGLPAGGWAVSVLALSINGSGLGDANLVQNTSGVTGYIIATEENADGSLTFTVSLGDLGGTLQTFSSDQFTGWQGRWMLVTLVMATLDDFTLFVNGIPVLEGTLTTGYVPPAVSLLQIGDSTQVGWTIGGVGYQDIIDMTAGGPLQFIAVATLGGRMSQFRGVQPTALFMTNAWDGASIVEGAFGVTSVGLKPSLADRDWQPSAGAIALSPAAGNSGDEPYIVSYAPVFWQPSPIPVVP